MKKDLVGLEKNYVHITYHTHIYIFFLLLKIIFRKKFFSKIYLFKLYYIDIL